MRKSITLTLLAFLFAPPSVWSQGEVRLNDSAPDRYVVEKGDTLWGIAARFLKEPWRWAEIWRMNKDQIANPNRIYPGNVIVLDRSRTPPQLFVGPTVKLSPQIRQERSPAEAIPSIPPKAIEPFLTRPLVIEQGGLEKAPRIVATQEDRVHLGPGAIAYVSGIGNSREAVWQVFRPGRELIDPDTRKTLGHEAVYLGTARVERAGDPATVAIVTTAQEISRGDRLIPAGAPAIVQYIPRAPSKNIRGRVIGLYDGLETSEAGRYAIVSINRGRRDGIEGGHVLGLLRTGASVADPGSTLSRDSAPRIQLPDERYGLVFVFRTFDAIAYALVMESTRPVTPGDIVQTP